MSNHCFIVTVQTFVYKLLFIIVFFGKMKKKTSRNLFVVHTIKDHVQDKYLEAVEVGDSNAPYLPLINKLLHLSPDTYVVDFGFQNNFAITVLFYSFLGVKLNSNGGVDKIEVKVVYA